MRQIFTHPLFFLGLLIRLLCIYFIAPFPVLDWFSPFLSNSIATMTFDPWASWITSGGTSLAFPYGYAMWLIFLPLTVLCKVLGSTSQYAYMLTLLVVDLFLLLALNKFLPDRIRLILLAYWLSPVVILATYLLGFNDLVPILFLMLAILSIQKIQLKSSGLLLACAISAKLSMLIALPFFTLYFLKNKPYRKLTKKFLIGLLIGSLALLIPFFYSAEGLKMILGNPEMDKIYSVSVNLSSQMAIYAVPLLYMTVLYSLWRIRRLNFDLFIAAMGITILLIVLTSPASPGWFVWAIPFLVIYQAGSGRIAVFLVGIFSVLYSLSFLLATKVHFNNGLIFNLRDNLQLSTAIGGHIASLMHTFMLGIGLIIAWRIWRETIDQNSYYRLSRKPFVIGVAGDSGVGKDTYVDSLESLFGQHSVAKVSGDDYHLWDRQKPIWHVITHLNPMANDLERFSRDLVSLVDGKKIQSKHYDHSSGMIGRSLIKSSNDFIIASGLHTLTMPMLRECCDLKIYIEMDEELRRFFKIKRDVQVRGHSLEKVLTSFSKRKNDSENFIHPQSIYADLIFSLQPIHQSLLNDLNESNIPLKLMVRTRNGFNENRLTRVLVGICGLHVDLSHNNGGDEIQMMIEGDASAEDMAVAADILCSEIKEFLDIPVGWKHGVSGVMQLITLSHINQVLTRRFI